MKLKKKQQEFIKQAYDEACSDWRLRIKEAFPKLFENKLEVGKWYKSSHHKLMIVFPQKIDKRGILYGYGFNHRGEWVYDGDYLEGGCLCNSVAAEDLIPATKEEVEKALIKEAKRRGFKEGVFFNSVRQKYVKGYKNAPASNRFGFQPAENRLHCNGFTAFYQGQWAEIIDTITKEEAEKELGKKIID